jgi:hypothetical protein
MAGEENGRFNSNVLWGNWLGSISEYGIGLTQWKSKYVQSYYAVIMFHFQNTVQSKFTRTFICASTPYTSNTSDSPRQPFLRSAP